MVDFTKEYCQKVDLICEKHGNDKANLIPILQETQDLSGYNYVSEEAASYIASKLDLTLVAVSSVISFYASLSSKPRGKNVIQICKSTSCLVNNYQSVRDILERELQLEVGSMTDDQAFSLEYTECIGACDISPAIRINKKVYGNLTEDKIKGLLLEYRRA